jgi:Zn-dependent protease with chaperone function
MQPTNPLIKDLLRIVMSSLMALFLVPLIAWSFVRYALPPKAARLIAEPFTTLWQFQVVGQVSAATLISGVGILLVVCALAVAAFRNRRTQYVSFVIGWRLLTAFCAVEVVVQGVLLVWLAFWITAFFFNSYYPKLIGIVAILAAVGIFYTIVCIFKRVPQTMNVEGQLINEGDASTLWAHIRELSTKAGTAPPDYIIAGIDTNFFVTESPLRVQEQVLSGRALFVSLPLLRLLDREESNAVLMHELAHFRGGDTTSSAMLGPKLVQYDYYCAMMQAAGTTLLVFYVLRLYRVIFEFALKRDSRDREFIADRTAATLVSAPGIVHALIKIGAYAHYRDVIEQKLFAEAGPHNNQIGIADRIANGLLPYAESADFLDAMKASSIPHPFDSHPALRERMRNVNYEVSASDYSNIVTQTTRGTWISDIQNADIIEQDLWAIYEQHFASAHEQQLAYRYLPATEAERAIVLKYFPPIEFILKGDQRIVVSYEGLMLPKETAIVSWDSVADLKYNSADFGSDSLLITHPEKGRFGAKTTKVGLAGIGKQEAEFKGVVGQYWQRHQIMRKSLND